NGTMDSGTQALTFTVSEMGATTMMNNMLALQYLPQLTGSGTIAASSLAPQYSQVNVSGNLTFTGTSDQRVIVTSVSNIAVGNITASGADGSKGGGGPAGPGGCDGGTATAGG